MTDHATKLEPGSAPGALRRTSWVSGTVVGIVLATFLSDVSHEMVTAVLPMYLASIGLGAAALGVIEGVADFFVSLSKLAGGAAGHRLRHKRPVAALAYLATGLATSSLAFVHTLAGLVSLRTLAWSARGFRGPLRDYLLADAVQPTHYGRAFGLERAGDMLGAVTGPLIAALLVWLGLAFHSLILWALAPGVLAACAFYFLTRERPSSQDAELSTGASHDGGGAPALAPRARIPRAFWFFLGGVLLFGMGDFSRTFLILIAATSLGQGADHAAGGLSLAIMLYAAHNAVSAFAAFPIGRLGDRRSKRRILIAGYAIGVGTNIILALLGASIGWIIAAIMLSGVYIAVQETMEKAAAAEMLPRELRSLGFGILAFANALGDMASSLYVGLLLQAGRPALAFGLAAGAGSLGAIWLIVLEVRSRRGRTMAARS